MKVIDQELIDEFLAISDKKEIAKILGVEYKILAYNLYKISSEEKYKAFEIKKGMENQEK